MSTAGSHPIAAQERRNHLIRPLAAALVLALIYGWLFSDFLLTQVTWALRKQADWGHTLVIPLIAGYFVYLRRRELLDRPFRTTWIGLVPVLAGTAWYALCTLNEAARNHNLQGLGVWVCLVGLAVMFFGFRAMRYLWFPLLYVLVFGQSISDRAMTKITFELQDIAARGSHLLLLLLGSDVERSGNMILLFADGREIQLNIAEACSGMRMLMAFLALGVALAYTGFRRFWQRALLVLLAVPTAIFVNMLRVVTLAWLSVIDVDLAAGDFHTFVGLVWLVPALLIYLGLMWVIRHLVIDEPAARDGGPAKAGEERG